MRSLLAVFGAGLTLAACGGKPVQDSQEKNVFGSDDRVEMTSTSRPFSAIGKLSMGGYMCTGTLVWHNLVLTNAHCVLDDEGQLYGTIKFTAGEGTSREDVAYASHTWWGTSNPGANRAQDWAIIKLDRSLSRYYPGYKSQQNLNPFNRSILMVGYSGDFYAATGKAGVHNGCRVRGEQNGFYLHDCDTRGGSSGGPLLARMPNDDGYYIIGINAAHYMCDGNQECPDGIAYSTERANIAVKTNAFTSKLTELRNANPQ